jgi:hypothetical protein
MAMAICDGDGDGGVAKIASGAKEGFGKQEEAAGPAGMLNLTTLQLGFSSRWQPICQHPGFPCHVSRCALHTLPLNVTISTCAAVSFLIRYVELM